MGMGFQEMGQSQGQLGGLSNFGGSNPFLAAAQPTQMPDFSGIWAALQHMLGGLGPNMGSYFPTAHGAAGNTTPGVTTAQPGTPYQQTLQPGQRSSLPGPRANPAGGSAARANIGAGDPYGGTQGPGFRGMNPWNTNRNA